MGLLECIPEGISGKNIRNPTKRTNWYPERMLGFPKEFRESLEYVWWLDADWNIFGWNPRKQYLLLQFWKNVRESSEVNPEIIAGGITERISGTLMQKKKQISEDFLNKFLEETLKQV